MSTKYLKILSHLPYYLIHLINGRLMWTETNAKYVLGNWIVIQIIAKPRTHKLLSAS